MKIFLHIPIVVFVVMFLITQLTILRMRPRIQRNMRLYKVLYDPYGRARRVPPWFLTHVF